LPIAFFDLDKTVISVNSANLWVWDEFRAGRLSYADAAMAGVWLCRYAFGAVSLSGPMREAVAALAGIAEDVFDARVNTFYRRRVAHKVRPGALAALARHRQDGHRCVLLTAASSYLAMRFCRDLELVDYLCSRFEVGDDGKFTGRAVEPMCFGSGKVEIATSYAISHGASLADCVFYSDSYSDMPMLDAVGNSIAVNPDRALRREASRRGWPCVDWGTHL